MVWQLLWIEGWREERGRRGISTGAEDPVEVVYFEHMKRGGLCRTGTLNRRVGKIKESNRP